MSQRRSQMLRALCELWTIKNQPYSSKKNSKDMLCLWSFLFFQTILKCDYLLFLSYVNNCICFFI